MAASQSHFKEDVPEEKFSEVVEEAKSCSNTYLWTALLALSTVLELVVVC